MDRVTASDAVDPGSIPGCLTIFTDNKKGFNLKPFSYF